MALVVIAGTPSCKQYAHAEFIAGFLSSKLPHFKVRRELIKEEEWEMWLNKTCEENGWYHRKCPIIWREIAMTGGKRKLIGSVGEFLEFCDEYYGLVYFPTDDELDILVEDNLEKFARASVEGREHEGLYKVPHILISGAASPLLTLLLSDLLKPGQKFGPHIYLYDEPEYMEYLGHIQHDTTLMGADTGMNVCEVVCSLEEGLKLCDLYVALDDFSRGCDYSVDEMYKQNYQSMKNLALILEKYAKPNCQIIFAGPRNTPSCFNATVLASFMRDREAHNVVALTGHFALEAVPIVAKLTGTRIQDFASPVVWGFSSDKYYIDFENMLYKATYFLPNKQALKRVLNSTLPQGKLRKEIRRFHYIINNVHNLRSYINKYQKEIEEFTGRPSELPKMKALVSLLNIWFSSDYDGEVVSLGVPSDGSFGIPKGLCFSQPAVLKDGVWKPYAEYPKPSERTCRLRNLIRHAQGIIDKYCYGMKLGKNWKEELRERHTEGRIQNLLDFIIQEVTVRGVRHEEKLEDIADILEDILDTVTQEKRDDLMLIEIPQEGDVKACEDEEEIIPVKEEQCWEYPNPLKIMKEARTTNIIDLQKSIDNIELQRKLDHDIDVGDFPAVKEKISRASSTSSSSTGRPSFHSEESLLRRKQEKEKKDNERNVTDILKDIVGDVDSTKDFLLFGDVEESVEEESEEEEEEKEEEGERDYEEEGEGTEYEEEKKQSILKRTSKASKKSLKDVEDDKGRRSTKK